VEDVKVIHRLIPIEESSDEMVIKECLSGNKAAYAILVQRHQRAIYNLVYRMTGEDEMAKDIAQESFVSAYSALKTFKGRARFSSWLYRITLNKCRDYLRSKRGNDLSPIDHNSPPLSEEANPEYRLRAKEHDRTIQRVLSKLPLKYRELLILKHIEELDYKEIAAMLGLSLTNLKVRTHRAREMFKEILRGEGIDIAKN
jgi:RNA polymerase sigma-70 factor, ECF subfamily